jgi:DNA invertase Pin-like site-specific DNA recombinase
VTDAFAYRREGPGLKWLLKDVACERVDIIVCEARDRLAGDVEYSEVAQPEPGKLRVWR